MDSDSKDIETKHKQQRKELQAKIQALKKTVTKGDKKKKKEVADEIARLERDLEAQQKSEEQKASGEEQKPTAEESKPVDDRPAESSSTAPEASGDDEPPVRLSRAAKRRNKKSTEAKEREQRIAEQEQLNKGGPRAVEMNAIKESLKQLGLQLFNIPADGNCLYCAVNHQLETSGRQSHTVTKLRKLTADFMRANKDDFLPFMYNESEESLDEQDFAKYCKEVATTKVWGGQLELRALSQVLECPIKVIQASGPPTLQGENFTGPELILTYHRHLYRLGEHYNSTVTSRTCD